MVPPILMGGPKLSEFSSALPVVRAQPNLRLHSPMPPGSGAKFGGIVLSQCAAACVSLYERRHNHEREGTPSISPEVRRRLRSARPPAHPGHAFRGCGSI